MKLKYYVFTYNEKTKKWSKPMKFTSLVMIERFYGADFDLTLEKIKDIYLNGDDFWKIEKII
jgi:hypothetical protein